MPPPVEPAPVRVELGSLHELLTIDRQKAGEARKARANAALTTVAYTTPLHVQWRRAFRRQRRLRVAAWSTCLGLVGVLAAAALWQLVSWRPALWRPTPWNILSLSLRGESDAAPPPALSR
jgi:hypothetical protein